jgi:DNA-directed RNA polymerase beta' subunit
MLEKVAKKPGSMRKHLYGTRSHFTFRGVITSFSSSLPYDDLHVPWQILTTAFRPHVLNKLINKYNYTHEAASDLLFRSTLKFNKLIATIGEELIAESKYKGIPVILHRNPSLLLGSAVLRYITIFKTDPIDTTIGCSILGMKSSNADVDGDK